MAGWNWKDEIEARRKAWRYAKEEGVGLLNRIAMLVYGSYPALRVHNISHEMKEQQFAGAS